MRRVRAPESWPWLILLAIPLLYLPYVVDWRVGFNSDTAIPYLEAREILRGKLVLQYWGQTYTGALEAWITAGLLLVFGRGAVGAFAMVPLLGYVATGVLVLRGSPVQLRLRRAFLLLFAPAFLFFALTRPHLQGSLLWLVWASLIALRPGLAEEPVRWREAWRVVAAGLLLAGAQYWTQPSGLGLYALGVVAVVLACVDFRQGRPRNVAARVAQLAGVYAVGQLWKLPTWLGLVQQGQFTGLNPLRGFEYLGLLGHGLAQFAPLRSFGPSASGIGAFSANEPLAWPVPRGVGVDYDWHVIPVAVLLWVGVAAGALTILRGVWRAVRDREQLPDVHGLYWCALLGGGMLAFLSFVQEDQISLIRYLAYLWIPLVICLSQASLRLPRRALAAAAVAWALMVVVGHARLFTRERAVHADVDRAIDLVRERGLVAGYGDYWLSYAITARSREELIVTTIPATKARNRSYAEVSDRQIEVVVFEFTRKAIQHRDRRMLHPSRYAQLETVQVGEVLLTFYRRR